jgi:hypothetical protein
MGNLASTLVTQITQLVTQQVTPVTQVTQVTQVQSPEPPATIQQAIIEINTQVTFKEAFKNIMPNDLTEIVLYIILVSIIILFIKLVQYTYIQSYIRDTSRCYKKAMENNYAADTYIIRGYTMSNIEIVNITYQFKEKKSTVEITVPKGDVLNKIKVPLYNIRTRDIEEIEKVFYGETDFDLLNETMVYEGNPELVKFMQFLTTDFFDNKL